MKISPLDKLFSDRELKENVRVKMKTLFVQKSLIFKVKLFEKFRAEMADAMRRDRKETQRSRFSRRDKFERNVFLDKSCLKVDLSYCYRQTKRGRRSVDKRDKIKEIREKWKGVRLGYDDEQLVEYLRFNREKFVNFVSAYNSIKERFISKHTGIILFRSTSPGHKKYCKYLKFNLATIDEAYQREFIRNSVKYVAIKELAKNGFENDIITMDDAKRAERIKIHSASIFLHLIKSTTITDLKFSNTVKRSCISMIDSSNLVKRTTVLLNKTQKQGRKNRKGRMDFFTFHHFVKEKTQKRKLGFYLTKQKSKNINEFIKQLSNRYEDPPKKDLYDSELTLENLKISKGPKHSFTTNGAIQPSIKTIKVPTVLNTEENKENSPRNSFIKKYSFKIKSLSPRFNGKSKYSTKHFDKSDLFPKQQLKVSGLASPNNQLQSLFRSKTQFLTPKNNLTVKQNSDLNLLNPSHIPTNHTSNNYSFRHTRNGSRKNTFFFVIDDVITKSKMMTQFLNSSRFSNPTSTFKSKLNTGKENKVFYVDKKLSSRFVGKQRPFFIGQGSMN